jgi:hypothetical protein
MDQQVFGPGWRKDVSGGSVVSEAASESVDEASVKVCVVRRKWM